MSEVRAFSVLETRYRRLLAAYPPQWRERNEEAVLGVLLDVAEADGRSAPTPREAFDLVARGLLARAVIAPIDGVRGRVAGIAAGIALGFSVVYFTVFIWPAGGLPPAAHAGPAAILLVWLIVGIAVLRKAGPTWRLAATGVAAFLPMLLVATRTDDAPGTALILSSWARPSDATAVFLLGLGLLAALGPIERRLLVRTALVSVASFAIGFGVTSAGQDPYDQSLWGTPDRSSQAAPGTLQALWGDGSGRMPLAQDHNGAAVETQLQGWLQGNVLRLDIVTVSVVLAAAVVGTVLLVRRRGVAGWTLLLLTCPFIAALIVCASQWVVWFQ